MSQLIDEPWNPTTAQKNELKEAMLPFFSTLWSCLKLTFCVLLVCVPQLAPVNLGTIRVVMAEQGSMNDNSFKAKSLKKHFQLHCPHENQYSSFCGDMQGGGESLDQLYRRCTSSMEKIARKHRGSHRICYPNLHLCLFYCGDDFHLLLIAVVFPCQKKCFQEKEWWLLLTVES